MPRELPRYVETFLDRHGRRRFYFRLNKKSARVPLPSDPKSDDFAEAYAAALLGKVREKRNAPRIAADTVGALISSYKRSPEYVGLRATTKQGYATTLRILEDKHGHRSLAGMSRESITLKILQPYADRPGQRLSILKMLRVLIRHGLGVGMLKYDPSAGIKRPKLEEIRSWTDAEIMEFEGHWPIDSIERLAFALMLYTGQRRSDVHRMTWADIEADTIRVVQQKTGAKLSIPLHSELRKVLASADRSHLAIITTAYGAARTVDGFSQFMRDAIRDAGLPLECRPHGLRKAAGRRLAEAGCTAKEIMAVLGHKTLSEAERYTRDADQRSLARNAIEKAEAQKRNKSSLTTFPKVGKISKKKGKSTW